MNYLLGTISHSTTGIKTITCGFQPLGARITAGPINGGSTVTRQSLGVTDGTTQVCDAFYQSDLRGKQNRLTEMVHVYDWNGTAFIDKVVATFSSFTATEFKYNVTTADVNYQFQIEVWG